MDSGPASSAAFDDGSAGGSGVNAGVNAIIVDWPCVVLFAFESYHVMTHVAILFGLRMLPRKDLVRLKFYFLFDTLTIFCVNFLYLRRLRWLATLQMIQHFAYVICWDKADFCRRVISWSSLDWSFTFAHRFDWSLILGTTFDLICHLVNAVLLYRRLPLSHVFATWAFCHFSLGIVFLNPRFAWSNPTSVPNWVRKRIAVIEENVGIERIRIEKKK